MCSCKNSGVLTEQTHQPPSLQCAHEPLAAQLVRASQSEATNTDGQKVKEAGEQNGLRHTRGSQPTTQRSHQQYVLLDMRMLNGLAVRFPHDNRRTFLSSLLLSSVWKREPDLNPQSPHIRDVWPWRAGRLGLLWLLGIVENSINNLFEIKPTFVAAFSSLKLQLLDDSRGHKE